MTFEEAFARVPSHGWLTEDEARLLWGVASRCEGPILEVGSYYGRSTVLLAALGRPIYAVDPFDHFDSGDPAGDRTHAAFLANLAERGINDVVLFRQRIEDWERRPVGFAYLDGDHTFRGTLHQIAAALDCEVKEVCLHDYCNDGEGRNVVKAVRAFKNVLERVEYTERMAHYRVNP